MPGGVLLAGESWGLGRLGGGVARRRLSEKRGRRLYVMMGAAGFGASQGNGCPAQGVSPSICGVSEGRGRARYATPSPGSHLPHAGLQGTRPASLHGTACTCSLPIGLGRVEVEVGWLAVATCGSGPVARCDRPHPSLLLGHRPAVRTAHQLLPAFHLGTLVLSLIDQSHQWTLSPHTASTLPVRHGLAAPTLSLADDDDDGNAGPDAAQRLMSEGMDGRSSVALRLPRARTWDHTEDGA